MNWFQQKRITIRAWWNAKRGNNYRMYAAIMAVHHAPPYYDPADELAQHINAQLATGRYDVVRFQESVYAVEDVMVDHDSPTGLRAGIWLAAGAETVGMTLLLRDQGMPVPERYLLAPALAMFMFIGVGLTVKYGTTTDEQGRTHRTWWVIALYVFITILVISFAAARVGATMANDTFTWMDLAGAVIMTATVLGPSAVAEYNLIKLRAVQPLAKRHQNMQRRLQTSQGTFNGALNQQLKDVIAHRKWMGEALESEQLYNSAFTDSGGTIPPDAKTLRQIVDDDRQANRPQPALASQTVAPVPPQHRPAAATLPPGFSYDNQANREQTAVMPSAQQPISPTGIMPSIIMPEQVHTTTSPNGHGTDYHATDGIPAIIPFPTNGKPNGTTKEH